MGHGLMFYVSDDNAESLRGVENRSALINELLDKHFQLVKMPKVNVQEAKELLSIAMSQDELKKREAQILNG